MRDININVHSGRLTRDPEVRHLASGDSVTAFSLAVDKSYKPKDSTEWKNAVVFLDYKVWNGKGEALANSCKKGDRVHVQSEADVETWEDKESKLKRSKVVFKVVDWQKFGDNTAAKSAAQVETATNAVVDAVVDDDGEDLDVPF